MVAPVVADMPPNAALAPIPAAARDPDRRVCSDPFRFLLSGAEDEAKRFVCAAFRIRRRDVKRVARQHEYARIGDLLLPGVNVVDRAERTALRRDDECRTVDARQVLADVPVRYRGNEPELSRSGRAPHELRPPFETFTREMTAQAPRHRAARPRFHA